ncbi:copper resistance protein CopC [Micromonospora sp. NPDC047548]|uniref:copper resistance CopC/CopD family protein n=1 Tax=Micromonospora sp. NPDC047548 TaxID=3155624 RepID=UPI0033F6183D
MSRSADPACWPAARIWLRLLGAAGVLLFVLLPARPAAAHAVLLESQPANGTTVTRVPRVALLRFSEDISPEFSSASLLDSTGRTVEGTRIATDRRGPRQLVLELPTLAPGTYGIAWRVLAEDDGHTTGGVVVFTAGNRSPGGPALQAFESGDDTPPHDVVRRWLGLCLLAGLIGGLAVAGVVLRPVDPAAAEPVRVAADQARRRALTLAAAAGGLAAVVGGADLVVQTYRSGPLGSSTAVTLLSDTRWGNLWLAREAVLLALAALALALRSPARAPHIRGPAPWTAVGLLVSVAVTVEALGGHAASVGPSRAVAVAAVAVHALTACLWLGGVATLAVVLARPDRSAAGRGDLLRVVGYRFTVLAAVGVALVVATGLYSAGREVESVRALVDTTYGRLLIAKGVLLSVAGGLGLVNAARVHGWLGTRLAAPPSRRLLSAEAAAGVVLLLLAGALVETPPSRQSTVPDTGVPTAVTRTESVGDVVVSVSVTPNRPGTNGFMVLAASSRRPPPAEIESVTVELDGGSTVVPLREIEPGRFFGTGDLSGPGVVPATAVIHRGGARLAVPLEWSVPPPAVSPPRSRDGLAPIANAAAAVVIGVLAVLAGWLLMAVRRRRPAATPTGEIEQRIREDVR